MNDAVLAAELDRIHYYTKEDDTPDRRGFKNCVRDLQVETEVRRPAPVPWSAPMRQGESPAAVPGPGASGGLRS